MANYSNISCTKVNSNYEVCDNCIKNNLNNCSTCPINQGICTACKYK